MQITSQRVGCFRFQNLSPCGRGDSGDESEPFHRAYQQLNHSVSDTRRRWPSFLKVVDSAEQQVAKVLTVITAVVIVAALVQLILRVSLNLISPQSANWLGDGLIKVLGDLLTVLIALEVLQNVTSYLRRHVVQLELVLVTALTAVARKVIVLPAGAENKPQLLIGLGAASIALAGAYWLVMRANPGRRHDEDYRQ